MAATYEIYMTSPVGQFLAVLDQITELTVERSVNNVGTLIFTVPWGSVNPLLFVDDAIFEVWRCPDNALPYLEGETFFLQHVASKKQTANGAKFLTITAYDPIEVIEHRNILYAANTANSLKTGPADDLVKAFFQENMGTLASADRNLGPYASSQANFSLGPTTSKAAAWKKLLPTMQEVAQDSFIKGTYLAFDLVYIGPATLEFRTYTGARGIDRSWPSTGLFSPVVLDPEMGNVTELELTVDNSEMSNVVYAAGQGQESARIVKTASDATSLAKSPWNRHEYLVDARSTSDPNSVQAEANFTLRQRRERKIFAARFVDTPNARYGVDFKFGDIITCIWDGEIFTMRADYVKLHVVGGEETVDIALRSDS